MTDTAINMLCSDIEWVKELYPRLKPSDAVIERYRAAIDLLPPIVVARGRILVDGFHRWQAHQREGLPEIAVIDLGELSDIEIVKESYRRNKAHGHQLETSDKKRGADQLYRQGVRDIQEICDLLGITKSTAETYLRDARRDEKREQQETLWDRRLDCEFDSYSQAAGAMDITDKTAKAWISEFSDQSVFSEPPESRQDYDIWSFPTADPDAGAQSYFGAIPPQVVENLLWYFTEPGDVVVDLFAGSGTTIDVAKAVGRRVWAADIRGNYYSPHLPIHTHDALTGWPDAAPAHADLVLLDPPYWRQARGRYSSEPGELAEMSLDDFNAAWCKIVKTVMPHAKQVAYIISPTTLLQDEPAPVDHAFQMLSPFLDNGWSMWHRIMVPYTTYQFTGIDVERARDARRMLPLYRDLVVLAP